MCGEVFSRQPLPTPAADGGHDVSSVSVNDARAFLSAYLNNRPGELERLRARLAPATLTKRVTKAEAAEAIVAWLTDDSGAAGNPGGFIDLGESEEEQSESFEEGDRNPLGDNDADAMLTLRRHIAAYHAATA